MPWVPTGVGIGLLASMLITTLVRPPEPTTPNAARVPPAPPAVATAAPPSPSPSTAPESPSAAPSPSSPRPSTGSPAPSRVAAWSTEAPDLTGRYRVVQSYRDGFIGEVLITNTGRTDRDWVVRMRFPSTVGDLRTSWVESDPQPSLTKVDGVFVWRSGAPVRAGGTVLLRFQFSRDSGTAVPVTCTVDEAPCDLP